MSNFKRANRFFPNEPKSCFPAIVGVLSLTFFLTFFGGGCQAQDSTKDTATPKTLEGWHQRVEKALQEGKADEALREMDAAIKSRPDNSQLLSIRGSLKFRSGKVTESLVDFDKCIELSPESKPFLWQRGIALYYAEKYKEGLEQFAVLRERSREPEPSY